MKLLILVLSLGLLAGCGGKPEQCDVKFQSLVTKHTTNGGDTVWTVAKPNSTKRALMIHGLTVDHTFFYTGWQGCIIDHMLDQGFEIVFIDLPFTTDPAPYTRLKSVLDSNYASTFQSRVTDVLDFADQFWGVRNQVMIGGISFGGLHAMMGCLNEARCSTYMALIPVVDLRALTGFENIYLSNFTPFNFENTLSQRQGYMQWCGADQAVNPQWSQNFVSQMTNISVNNYPLFPHGITKEQAYDASNWIDGVIL